MASLKKYRDNDGNLVNLFDCKSVYYIDKFSIIYCGDCASTFKPTTQKGLRAEINTQEYVECQGCFELVYGEIA